MNANPTKDLRTDWFAFMEGACIGDIPNALVKETARERSGRRQDETSDHMTAMRTAGSPEPQPGKRA